MIEAARRECPRCGGATRPIDYGLPDLEAFGKADRGEAELGGCIVHDEQPHSRCTDCGVTLLNTDEGLEVLDPPSFLLAWNPDRWDWPDEHRQAVITLTAYGNDVPGRWSSGIRKQGIHPGDYLYLVRQGTERGIVGWARATSEIYEDAHYTEEDRSTTYVDLEWVELFDTEDRLPVEVLEQTVPGVAWDSLRGSGVRPPAEAAADLERAWNDHLEGLLDRRLERGGDCPVRSEAEMQMLTAGDAESHLYAAVDFDGDVRVDSEVVELVVGTRGTRLTYPFSIQQLYALAREVEDELADDEDDDE